MSNIADFNPLRAWDGNGVPVSGAQAWFYDSGTDQRRPIYADTGAEVEHPQPLIADAAGVFPAVFVEGGAPVRVEVRDADGVMLPGYPIDPARVASIDGGTAAGIAFEPTDDIPAMNVQQAIEMARASAIQPVIDLGLGVTGNGPLLENLNATGTPSGIYRVTSASIGTWPSGVTAGDGIVFVERHSSLKATQKLKMISGGVYVRRLNTTWSGWAQLLDASTHAQATWNAGTDSSARAISPAILKSWRDTWSAAWGHAQSIWNTGTDTGLRAISPKILTDWLKAKIGTPGSTGLSLLAATSASAARSVLALGALATKSTVSNTDWSGTDLSIANGGTGASTAAAARSNLELGAVARDDVVPVARGGTGSTTQSGARTGLGFTTLGSSLVTAASAAAARTLLALGGLATKDAVNNADWSGTDLSVANGGTGASTASGARANLELDAGATMAAASQAQAQAGTDNSTIMTPLRVEQHMQAHSIGWGQQWYDMTSTWGSAYVAYQNTYGRPIEVRVFGKQQGGGGLVSVSHNGSTWEEFRTNADGDDDDVLMTFTLPAGHYWRRNLGVDAGTLQVMALR